jgi:transcriptional regulator with GAF, ATPase, and Fis domain
MDASIAAHALARASATLIGGSDVPGTLAALLNGCREALDVDAAGILVETNGRLELLSASTHAAVELELHQAQLDEGPCVDAHASGEPVAVTGAADLAGRWPTFGASMVDSGFRSVHASPVRWQQSTLGAMGLFRRAATPFTADDDTFAQAFADIAASLIVSAEELTTDELTKRLERALEARIVIEQAKGVLAEQFGLDMDDAYELLVKSAADSDERLVEQSARIVREAGTR